MDLTTILKAIQIVGAATEAGKKLYDGFKVLTTETDQATLDAEYAKARAASDDVHARVHEELGS